MRLNTIHGFVVVRLNETHAAKVKNDCNQRRVVTAVFECIHSMNTGTYMALEVLWLVYLTNPGSTLVACTKNYLQSL